MSTYSPDRTSIPASSVAGLHVQVAKKRESSMSSRALDVYGTLDLVGGCDTRGATTIKGSTRIDWEGIPKISLCTTNHIAFGIMNGPATIECGNIRDDHPLLWVAAPRQSEVGKPQTNLKRLGIGAMSYHPCPDLAPKLPIHVHDERWEARHPLVAELDFTAR